MLKVILLLGVVGLISAENPYMGPCRSDIEGQMDFDYKKFTQTNGGVWQYVYVPNNDVFAHVHKMFLEEKVTDTNGVYRSTVYEQKGRETPTVFSDQVRSDDGKGHLSGLSIQGHNEYKYTVMAHKPGEYVYFYICSSVGGDQTTDYRFVLVNGELSSSAKERINDLEEQYQFKETIRLLI